MAILRANISGEEHDIDYGENAVGNYEGFHTPFENFTN